MPNHDHQVVNEFEKFLIKKIPSSLNATGKLPIQFEKSGNIYTLKYFEGCLTTTNDRGYAEWLIPYFIGNTATGKIYYGLSIVIEYGRTVRSQLPDHISLKYYAGDRHDELSIVFRAEYAEKHMGLDHAQPHWHFHFLDSKTATESFEEILDSFGADAQFVTQTESPLQRLVGVHFPYCWDKKRKTSEFKYKMTSPSEIKDWLEFTTSYVWEQLSLIHK